MQGRLVPAEPPQFRVVLVVQVGHGEGPVHLVEPLDQLATLFQGGDLAAGDGGRVVGRIDQPTLEVERGAGLAPLAELGRGAQQVERHPALLGGPRPLEVGGVGQHRPAGHQPLAPLGGPPQLLDHLDRPPGEHPAEPDRVEPTVVLPAEFGPERLEVPGPSLHPLAAVDPDADDGDLVDQPGLELVLRLERVEPVGRPLAGPASGPRRRRPRRRGRASARWPGSAASPPRSSARCSGRRSGDSRPFGPR